MPRVVRDGAVMPTNVGGSDMVLTFNELAAPGRAYISNEAYSAVPANLETDEMRIAMFPKGSTEPMVNVTLRGREGLLTWHKENAHISLDQLAPMPIAKLLGRMTSNAVLFRNGDVQPKCSGSGLLNKGSAETPTLSSARPYVGRLQQWVYAS